MGPQASELDPCFCSQFPPSTKNFQEAQSQLNQAAAGLNQSVNELVQASRGTPQNLAKASGKFGQDFNEFLQAGVEMAGQSQVRAAWMAEKLSSACAEGAPRLKARAWVHSHIVCGGRHKQDVWKCRAQAGCELKA